VLRANAAAKAMAFEGADEASVDGLSVDEVSVDGLSVALVGFSVVTT
jgi:hypothetical protein